VQLPANQEVPRVLRTPPPPPMKLIFPLVTLVSLIAAVSGCRTATPSSPKSAQSSQGQSNASQIKYPDPSTLPTVVNVYRSNGGAWRGQVDISIDGKKVVTLGEKEFSQVLLGPGNHTFRAEWASGETSQGQENRFETKTLTMNFQAGSYYLCYEIRESGASASVEFASVDQAHALPVLNRCVSEMGGSIDLTGK